MAYCKVCAKLLRASSGKTDLIANANSEMHKKHARSVHYKPNVNLILQNTKIDKGIMNAKIQFSSFVAEHNIAFRVIDHLVPLSKHDFYDSKIASKKTCGRTKTTAIVKNVVGKRQFDNLCQILREKKFSLCCDKSTEIRTTKMLSIVVRVEINSKICDIFFCLYKVVNNDAIALYQTIVKALTDNGID